MNRQTTREIPILDRVRELREQLSTQGPQWQRQPGDFVKVAFPRRDADLVRDLLIAEGVETVIEVGLAYGSSALAICEALLSSHAQKPKHIVIDPFQATSFSNVGSNLLMSVGLNELSRLIEKPSSVALPQLVAEQTIADAAFIDGSHRFHEVLLDLYYLRKLLRPGGVVILDDYCWPSVQAAVRYFELNMKWKFLSEVSKASSIDEASKLPRICALRLLDPTYEPPFEHFKSF